MSRFALVCALVAVCCVASVRSMGVEMELNAEDASAAGAEAGSVAQAVEKLHSEQAAAAAASNAVATRSKSKSKAKEGDEDEAFSECKTCVFVLER